MAHSEREPEQAQELNIDIPPEPRRVPEVRHALRRCLVRWRLQEERRVVELLASELLARAVIHARTTVHVTLRYDGEHIRVEVGGDFDRSPQRLRSVAGLAERRSEAIVAALSARHGGEAEDGDEMLWFELDHRPR